MDITFIIKKEKADYIVRELGSKVKLEPYIKKSIVDPNFISLTISEFNGFDALALFHAGENYGFDSHKLVRQG